MLQLPFSQISDPVTPVELLEPLPLKALNFPTALPEKALFSAAEMITLGNHLIERGWQRIAAEFDDSIGMLYNQPARHWTVGWAPDGNTLYMVSWHLQSWDAPPQWMFFENNVLRYCFTENPLNIPLSKIFSTLLEDEDYLPVVSSERFLKTLTTFNAPLEHREHTASVFLEAVEKFPDILPVFQNAIFDLMETDLGNPEWPVLDPVKIHRLGHKNVLIELVLKLTELGQIPAQSRGRFHHALKKLARDYDTLSPMINSLNQPEYDAALTRFNALTQNILDYSPQTVASLSSFAATFGNPFSRSIPDRSAAVFSPHHAG